MDEEFDSIFKTKVNEEHLLKPHKKMAKFEQELTEGVFYHAMQ